MRVRIFFGVILLGLAGISMQWGIIPKAILEIILGVTGIGILTIPLWLPMLGKDLQDR